MSDKTVKKIREFTKGKEAIRPALRPISKK